MLLDAQECQLVLMDYQARLMPVMLDAAAVVANAARLAHVAALMQVPVVATEQNPSRLGPTVDGLQAALRQARARTLSKMQFSAVEEGLGEWLRPEIQASQAPQGNARSLPKHLQKPAAPQRQSIVLAGCEAHICMLQTALDLVEDEFEVWVATDACTSRTERNRDAAFDRLASAGVELVTTEMVAYEWLRSAEHPAFKAMLQLVK
jgi:nicotinamidase-related amidase